MMRVRTKGRALGWSRLLGPVAIVAGLVAIDGCGGRHMTPADADADGDADAGDGWDGDRGDVESDGDVALPDSWMAVTPEAGRVTAVAATSGGDLLVGGQYFAGPWVARLDSAGRPQWSRAVPGGGEVEMLEVTDRGTAVIFVESWLAELGPDGDVLWHQAFDIGAEDVLMRQTSAAALGDGSFIVVAASDRGMQLLRYSPEEGVLWRRRLVRGGDPGGARMAISADGTIFIDALYHDGASVLVVVLALDEDGELLWAKRFVGAHPWVGYALVVAPSPDGGFVLGGAEPLWVISLDSDGGVGWSVQLGPVTDSYDCDTCTMVETLGVGVGPAGDVLAVGHFSYSDYAGATNDALAVLVGPDGRVRWQIQSTGPSRESGTRAAAAAALPDGRWLLGGQLGQRPSSSYIGFLAVLSPEGEIEGGCDLIPFPYEPEPLEVEVEPITDFSSEEGDLVLSDRELEVVDAPLVLGRLCP